MSSTNPQEADAPEEILDLVDNQDNVVGQATRKDIYAQGLHNYRVVHAFIKNSQGQLWIPKRVASKKLYPDALDFSVAGHVESGETYEKALIKEAVEEVRLALTPTDYREIGYFWPQRDDVGVFQKVYEINSDATPDYDANEFASYEWLLPREIIERHRSGIAMKSDLPRLVQLCYLD